MDNINIDADVLFHGYNKVVLYRYIVSDNQKFNCISANASVSNKYSLLTLIVVC